MWNCEDPEELTRFMEKYYPDYKGNLELAKILCRKWNEKRKGRPRTRSREYRRAKIGELKPKGYYEVEGVVTNVSKTKYMGCPDKKKTGCRKSDMVEWKITGFELADDTGSIWVSRIDEDWLDVDDMYVVRVRGWTKLYKGEIEMSAHDVDVIAKPRSGGGDDNVVEEPSREQVECVDKLVETVKSLGDMYLETFAQVLDKKCRLDEKYADWLTEHLKKQGIYIVHEDGERIVRWEGDKSG